MLKMMGNRLHEKVRETEEATDTLTMVEMRIKEALRQERLELKS